MAEPSAAAAAAASPGNNDASKQSQSKKDGDNRLAGGYAWLTTFVPALLYFIATRTVFATHRGGVGRRYDVASDVVIPLFAEGGGDGRAVLGEIFRLTKASSKASATPDEEESPLSLSYPLETILSGPPPSFSSTPTTSAGGPASTSSSGPVNPLLSITSLLWVHDPELGRGYLLLSDSALSGRIWRWEVGGGPITIGRSLHMEWSGCRSDAAEAGACPDNKHPFHQAGASAAGTGTATTDDLSRLSQLGSAGLAVQFAKGSEHHRTGHLLVLERGERRLVRIEEDGARTPLVLDVPLPPGELTDDGGVGGEGKMVRMRGDGFVVYTPFGDAVFSDSSSSGGASAAGVYRLKEAVNVPPIPSSLSLEAHSWNETQGVSEEVELLYGGMDTITGLVPAMSAGGEESVLVAGRLVDDKGAGIVRVALSEAEDDDESSDDEKQPTAASAAPPSTTQDTGAKLVHDLSDLFPSRSDGTAAATVGGPALTIDAKGRVYASYPGGILILSPNFERLGYLPLTATTTTSNGDSVAHSAHGTITDLEIGEDGYLYASTATALLRIRIKAKMGTVATDLVVPGGKTPT